MDPYTTYKDLEPGIYTVSGVGQTEKDPNEMVKDIISRDQRIYQKLLVMREIEDRLPTPFQTPELQNTIDAIKQRYEQRQQEIEDLDGVQNVQRGTIPAFEWLMNKFKAKTSGIGFAISGTVVAIVAVGTLAVGGAATSYIVTHYQQAKSDERKLEQLLKKYEQLGGEKAEDLKPLIQEASAPDTGGSWFSGWGSTFGWVIGIGLGGYVLSRFV